MLLPWLSYPLPGGASKTTVYYPSETGYVASSYSVTGPKERAGYRASERSSEVTYAVVPPTQGTK